uniref:Uncharacterized protein n=1 Tax=Aphis glycines nege-like virus 1 iso 1 TaxID=2961855 RepID=A0A976RXC4_9VIRU|nr:hypothetical protein 2 [Aphis glycines nege-like virus 1 iso 1]
MSAPPDWNLMVEDYNRNNSTSRTSSQPIVRAPRKKKNLIKFPKSRSSSKKIRNRRTSPFFDINKVFVDYSSTISRAVSNPTFLLCVALVIGYFIAHDFELKKGPLYDIINDKNDTLSSWFRNNTEKISGVTLFLPTVVDTQKNYQSLVFVSILFWVILLPSFGVLEYSLQSLSLHTYLRLKTPQSRVTILVVVFFSWLMFYSRSGK